MVTIRSPARTFTSRSKWLPCGLPPRKSSRTATCTDPAVIIERSARVRLSLHLCQAREHCAHRIDAPQILPGIVSAAALALREAKSALRVACAGTRTAQVHHGRQVLSLQRAHAVVGLVRQYGVHFQIEIG